MARTGPGPAGHMAFSYATPCLADAVLTIIMLRPAPRNYFFVQFVVMIGFMTMIVDTACIVLKSYVGLSTQCISQLNTSTSLKSHVGLRVQLISLPGKPYYMTAGHE